MLGQCTEQALHQSVTDMSDGLRVCGTVNFFCMSCQTASSAQKLQSVWFEETKTSSCRALWFLDRQHRLNSLTLHEAVCECDRDFSPCPSSALSLTCLVVVQSHSRHPEILTVLVLLSVCRRTRFVSEGEETPSVLLPCVLH